MTVLPEPVRPVFTLATLPGGSWRAYRPSTTVDAVYVAAPFAVIRGDGIHEMPEGWVFVEDGKVKALDATDFSAAFESLG